MHTCEVQRIYRFILYTMLIFTPRLQPCKIISSHTHPPLPPLSVVSDHHRKIRIIGSLLAAVIFHGDTVDFNLTIPLTKQVCILPVKCTPINVPLCISY